MLQSVQEWDLDFAAFVAKLGKTKPVIVAGDFNCEHPSLIAVSVQVLWDLPGAHMLVSPLGMLDYKPFV